MMSSLKKLKKLCQQADFIYDSSICEENPNKIIPTPIDESNSLEKLDLRYISPSCTHYDDTLVDKWLADIKSYAIRYNLTDFFTDKYFLSATPNTMLFDIWHERVASLYNLCIATNTKPPFKINAMEYSIYVLKIVKQKKFPLLTTLGEIISFPYLLEISNSLFEKVFLNYKIFISNNNIPTNDKLCITLAGIKYLDQNRNRLIKFWYWSITLFATLLIGIFKFLLQLWLTNTSATNSSHTYEVNNITTDIHPVHQINYNNYGYGQQIIQHTDVKY